MTQVWAELRARDPNREKQWLALVDGSKTRLSLSKKLAQPYRVHLVIVIVLDIINLLEYLWKAADPFQAKRPKRGPGTDCCKYSKAAAVMPGGQLVCDTLGSG